MLNKLKKYRSDAFTLIEIFIVIFVFFIIVVISNQFLIAGFKSITFNDEQEIAIEHARDAMEDLTKTIRGANYSQRGDYVLGLINPQEIEFYADIDSDYQMEKIRYFVDGASLIKVVFEPGVLNTYNATSSNVIVADYVNNTSEPIFVYYDSNRNITDIINEVRSIGVNLKINVTPSRAPNDYILESDVQLRNLKDNL